MLLPLDYLGTEVMRRRDIVAQAGSAAPDALAPQVAEQARALTEVAALRRLSVRFDIAFAALFVGGILLGAGTVHTISVGDMGGVNIGLLLLTLLGPHTAALVLWSMAAVLAIGHLAPIPGWLGERCLRAWQFCRASGTAPPLAAVLVDFLLRTSSGRLRLALLSHLLWFGLMLGACGACWTWFAFRQVDFHWSTTVLRDDTVNATLVRLARPVALAGFAVPARSAIAASRLGSPAARAGATRRAWGYFVIGALTVYGLAPRLLLLTMTGVAMSLADRRLRRASATGRQSLARAVLDADEAPPRAELPPSARTPAEPWPEAAAWLALERPLPPLPAPVVDLGLASDRASQTAILAQVAAAQAWPALVVGTALGVTPDRGLERFVTQLVQAAAFPVYLSLHGDVTSAAWPTSERRQRSEDWYSLARRAGIPRARVHGAFDA
jgi:hypothetical protein